MVDSSKPSSLREFDAFAPRHTGSGPQDLAAMLATIGVQDAQTLVDETIPATIRLGRELELPAALGERACLEDLAAMADKNLVLRSFLGLGYHACLVPTVIQRNILENPAWYTQYTPYQAEIAQGRLEALLTFQTMVSDLTGLPLANASLLDEATAAAEALAMCQTLAKGRNGSYFVAERCHPQTLAVVRTRAEALSIPVLTGDPESFDFEGHDLCGALLQVPDTYGRIEDLSSIVERIHKAGAKVVVATDLLALTLMRSPGEFGADIAVGSAQRFGVPLGYGGPHAGFLAATEAFKRVLPGRIIGLSKDSHGNPALRMAMQTREQHIRRDKATSNICTAQVLLAIMSGMYAVYHGAEGLRTIASRVHRLTSALAALLSENGHAVEDGATFDTILVTPAGRTAAEILKAARQAGFNLREVSGGRVGIALDEPTTIEELIAVLGAFGITVDAAAVESAAVESLPAGLRRKTEVLTHPVFRQYRTEHECLRYLKRLESRDLSLVHSMIPLGSCTMKLNATSEMMALTWPGFSDLHPFVPADQARGYGELFDRLERALCEITGFAAMSLQPNAGSQGEYAGLLAIRGYHHARGDQQRNVCLIPVSAHGTNPASAVMAGLKVVVVGCDEHGNVDVADLTAKAELHADRLAALMVTYPSTHGVFESEIREMCDVVHRNGGQVYLDGANLNAQVGLCRPGDYGADVCHLNLHKTFCIPHGGGGPGMGPIGVAEHLVPHLPSHPFAKVGGDVGPVAAAPFGSSLILTISYAYIAMMGPIGLRQATEVAIVNANYMAKRLEGHFDIVYRGKTGRVAHEFILDLRPFGESAHVSAEDVAKRLMDYGFHSPTLSWPVMNTMMIEPTESESKAELDRLCDALISIRSEIRAIEEGRMDQTDNPLLNAPHTSAHVTADDWSHPYSRETAAFPAPWCRDFKFWPHVGRVDNGYGDKNLVCTCPPLEAYEEAQPEPALQR